MVELKRVSFKIAKVIKEAGYPQEWYDTEYYYNISGELKYCDDYKGNNDEDIMYYQRNAIPAPYVIEVWLWLWRKKKIYLVPRLVQKDETIGDYTWLISPWDMGYIKKASVYGFHDNNEENPYKVMDDVSDPEEAIIAAIEYLVDNNLIK